MLSTIRPATGPFLKPASKSRLSEGMPSLRSVSIRRVANLTPRDWTCRNCVLQPKKYAHGRRYHDTAKVSAAVSLRSSVSSSLGPNSPTISTGTTGSPVDSSSTLICNFPGCSKLMIPPSRWCQNHWDIVRNFDLSRSPHLLPSEPLPKDRAEYLAPKTIEQVPPLNGMESLSEPGNSSKPRVWTETLVRDYRL